MIKWRIISIKSNLVEKHSMILSWKLFLKVTIPTFRTSAPEVNLRLVTAKKILFEEILSHKICWIFSVSSTNRSKKLKLCTRSWLETKMRLFEIGLQWVQNGGWSEFEESLKSLKYLEFYKYWLIWSQFTFTDVVIGEKDGLSSLKCGQEIS